MLSFLLATACIVGIVAVARGTHRWSRWTRWGPRFGCGRGELGGRFGEDRWGRHRDFGDGAAEKLRHAKERIRQEEARLRREVAQALRAEQFNPDSIREIFARHHLLISDPRAAALEVLSKVDEGLDDRQRKMLADLSEPGAGFHRGAAGYGGYV